MKKSLLLFAMAVLPLTMSAFNYYDVKYDGIYYGFDAYRNAGVTYYNGGDYSGDVVIPAAIFYDKYQYDVLWIADGAFKRCTDLTSVTFRGPIQSIGHIAFQYCSSLTSITIPNSVTSIGDQAFYGCSGLTSISIPSGVTSIGDYAFVSCTSLTSVTLGSDWTNISIGKDAFVNCTSLTSVTMKRSTPIAISSDIFPNRANITLYIPKGCSEAYLAADYWKEFGAIVEMPDNGSVLATNISLSHSTLSLAANETATLTATITPSNVTVESVRWTSSDTNVATVSSEGVVSAITDGTATITVTTNDGTNLSASCKLTVSPPVKATAIGLSQTSLSFTAANETATLTATITPSNVTDGSVTWTSSNTNVATVSSEGVVTAIANGTATITATTNDGTNLSSTCTVNVNIAVPTEPDTDISALDNVIYINKVEAGAGQEFDLSIKMKNTAAIRGYQFDLYLPDGMSVVKDEDGYPLVNLSTERTRMGRHTVEGIIQSDGALRVLSGAQRDYTYSGNDGEVCTITVHISDEMAEGDYPIIFRNIKLTETDISQTYNTSYLKATLSVSTYTLGDINGDGAIDVADYIGVANAILGMPPTSYVEKAADVNVDGIVDVADYIGVANLILYGNVYGSNGNQVKTFVLTPEDIFIGSVIRK